MIGKVISHYKIIEELGRGGMGVVYKAHDTKLKRTVALKFLPFHLTRDETDKFRFLQEARAVAALNHPNVCTIHEIHDEGDNPFIVMEYVEGETLRDMIHGKPPEVPNLRRLVDVAIQIAKALKTAHKKGIVHRDIKSENIMVTGDGRVKVMDFGLAKLRGGAKLTKTGSTAGTVAYMSPEQARGETVDLRTDIWSFGVVLYQMMTGKLPFTGEYEQAVIYSILNDDVKIPSEVHSVLENIIKKCLEKNPTKRYPNTESIIEDLGKIEKKENAVLKEKSSIMKVVIPVVFITVIAFVSVYFLILQPNAYKINSRPESWENSIAVLSFTDMSSEHDQEYFCDGMAEEIINALTNVQKLRVIARTSAFAFKGKNEDVRNIGKQLGVETLLEGSVRKSGDRLRVTAQLIRTSDGAHLWSNSYDRNLTDVFTIQDEIALAIVDNLKIKLLGGEENRMARRFTGNLEAYNLYIRGRHILNRRKAEDIYTAIDYFENALEIDSLYVMGYIGLADAYALLPSYASAPENIYYPKAKEAVIRALEINDQVGEAYASLGWIRILADWDWKGAEQAFQTAIRLNPGYATAYHWYGYLYMYLGEFDQSLIKVKRALELDPLSPVINRVVGDVYYYDRQFDKAISSLKRCLELEPCIPFAHLMLCSSYQEKSMFPEARRELLKEKECRVNYTWVDYVEGLIYTRMGETEKARQVLEQLQSIDFKGLGMAQLYFFLNEDDRGYEMLEDMLMKHSQWIIYINIHLNFDRVRPEPRFQNLLKEVGFK